MMTRRQRVTQALTIPVSSLSFGKLVAIVSGLVTLAAAAGATARAAAQVETTGHAAATYARRDSLTLWRQRDSLTLKATVDAIQKDVLTLVRACQRKGDCP